MDEKTWEPTDLYFLSPQARARLFRNAENRYGFQLYKRNGVPVGDIEGPYDSVGQAIEALQGWKI